MNTTKKILFIALILVFLPANLAFANNLKEVSSNPMEMSSEERAEFSLKRAEWAVENIEPKYSEGIWEESDEGEIGTLGAGSGWLTTGRYFHRVETGPQLIGTLATKVRWEVNHLHQVINYNTLEFEVIPYVGWSDKEFRADMLTPSNLRLIYDSYFIDILGNFHALSHQYNLHGHGAYSFRVY